MNKSKKKLIIEIIVFVILIILISILYNKFAYQNIENDINKNIKEEEKKVSVLKITSKNFEEEVLNSSEFVIVDFYADWCGPCKMMAPIMEEIAGEVENAKVCKVNVDEAQDLAIKYNVMSIPTIIIFKDGEIKQQFVGVTNKATILNSLK